MTYLYDINEMRNQVSDDTIRIEHYKSAQHNNDSLNDKLINVCSAIIISFNELDKRQNYGYCEEDEEASFQQFSYGHNTENYVK